MPELAVTRFAPSPTGHLHVGGARTALFNWALARKLGGKLLLRIEDTDVLRSSDSAVAGILEDLAWLGIAWDEGPEHAGIGGDPRGVGPFFQSQRLALYREAADALIARDFAYPAFETPEELEALRKRAQQASGAFRYARPASWDRAAALARAKTEPHVVRFRMPHTEMRVHDEILGDVSFPADFLDDFVILKRDGYPTYHLGVVVDDQQMGVTHVLRGQEHLNNTPRHIALQRALGFRTPLYAHLPLIQNPEGSKMSKRDKDKAARKQMDAMLPIDVSLGIAAAHLDEKRVERWRADSRAQLETDELDALERELGMDLPGVVVEDFRRAGYLPEVVVNFLALLGWNPGEKLSDGRDREHFDMAYLGERFELARVGRGNAKFDRAKLLAFSQEKLAALSDAEWLARWQAWCERYAPEARAHLADHGRALVFAAAMKSRCRTLAEASAPNGPGRFALVADDGFAYDEKAVAKWLAKGEPPGAALLSDVRGVVGEVSPFTPAAIESAVAKFCELRGIGMGKVAQPLRVALTGAAASPPLGETLAILGRKSVLRRIERCLSQSQ